MNAVAHQIRLLLIIESDPSDSLDFIEHVILRPFLRDSLGVLEDSLQDLVHVGNSLPCQRDGAGEVREESKFGIGRSGDRIGEIFGLEITQD